MTQRIEAELLLEKISLPTEKELAKLQAVLEKAQNPPPQGAADGSINKGAWEALKTFIDCMGEARIAKKDFGRRIS